MNGSTSHYASTGNATWLNGLSAVTVLSYHRAVGTDKKYEVFNVASGANADLSIHMDTSTSQQMTFVARFGSTAYQYQTANNRQSIDGQAMAVTAQAGQAVRMAIDGTLDVPSSAATIAASTTTSATNPLEWGRGGRTGAATIYWDGDLAFLGFCSEAQPTAALESMTAAFSDPSRVYTLGSFAAVT